MASLSSLFKIRWRSALHIGAAKPTMVVRVRKGRFIHGEVAWVGSDVGASIPGESDSSRRAPTWTPSGDWLTVPSVFQCDLDQSFDNNGLTVGTVQIENWRMKAINGIAGVFHIIQRGAFSPYYGFEGRGRPKKHLQDNEWYAILNRGCQVEVKQGYGDELATTFTGLIDDVDMVSHPDRITITARCFGQTLTDQLLFGHIRSKKLVGPTVFADRKSTVKRTEQGGGARASSESGGHNARFVIDDSKSSYWMSAGRTNPNPDDPEWIEILVPTGKYQQVLLHPGFAGMDAYICVKPTGRGLHGHAQRDGVNTPHDEWVDIGKGDVPGTDVPWVNRVRGIGTKENTYALDGNYEVGSGTNIRIYLLNMRERNKDGGGVEYRAAMRKLKGISEKVNTDIDGSQPKRWILVDDAADVVKVILRWAGFKEWDVQTTGLSIDEPLVFHQGEFLIDVINRICEVTGYVFFIGDPSGGEDEFSIGVPVFRHNNALDDSSRGSSRMEVTEDKLLTGIQIKYDDEPLRTHYRVRGKAKKRKAGGITRGEDKTKRVEYFFKAPWARGKAGSPTGRHTGLVRYFIRTEPLFKDEFECQIAALYQCLMDALESLKGIIETAGYPGVGLDEQISIVDTGTGMNTRLWVSQRSSTFTTGENAEWKSTFGGACLDSPDIIEVKKDLKDALNDGEVDEQDKWEFGGRYALAHRD